jgi:hypothetical protein
VREKVESWIPARWSLLAVKLTGLRDRALIGVMIYTFARVGAVLNMNVCDYFSQGRRGWVNRWAQREELNYA